MAIPFVIICDRIVNFLACVRVSTYFSTFLVHFPLPDLLKFLMSIFIPTVVAGATELLPLLLIVCEELSHFPVGYVAFRVSTPPVF